MIGRTARTLTAVSALVLGFGPSVVQAAEANNTPYAKYVDCSSSGLRTSCVERGEVMNFGQLRDIIAAAMYREEMERKRLLTQPDPDSSDRPPSYTSTNGSTPRQPSTRVPEPTTRTSEPMTRTPVPTTRVPETSTSDSSTPTRLQDGSVQPAEQTAESTETFPPVSPASLPVVVRYERGTDDQSSPSSRLIFTVKDETGEPSSYSVNVSDETGQYIEKEIIRSSPAPMPTPTDTGMTATTPLDMQDVVVSQEMVPVIFNSEAMVAASVATAVPPSSPSRPMAASPLPSETTVQAEMQTVAAPAPSRSTVTYVPPARISIMESSVEYQPITVSYYTYRVEEQPITATYYRFTVPETTETVTASPVITLRMYPEQSTDQTITLTARNADESTITVRPYVVMISPTETVHVVPQQVETPVNVLAAFRDNSVGVTPGENVRDQSYSGMNETPAAEPSAPSPSNDNDDDDDDDNQGPVN